MQDQDSVIKRLRMEYHQALQRDVWFFTSKNDSKTGKTRLVASNADASSRISVNLANKMLSGVVTGSNPTQPGQTSGSAFQRHTRDFVAAALERLSHIRPGPWKYDTEVAISRYDQYKDLAAVDAILTQYQELRTTFGTDYLIKPDIVVGRLPLDDVDINKFERVISTGDRFASYTPLRKSNVDDHPILHASISCKWTLRSDRAQNARTEALNLLRNRKGNAPHIVVVTGEPLPTRIMSLALGTGDVDCVYHMALHELHEAICDSRDETQTEVLHTLVEGRRLRDISDLPFDLAV